jgi:hypothetical protein
MGTDAFYRALLDEKDATIERLRGLLRRLRVESLHHKGCACSLCREIDAALAGTTVQPSVCPVCKGTGKDEFNFDKAGGRCIACSTADQPALAPRPPIYMNCVAPCGCTYTGDDFPNFVCPYHGAADKSP